MIIEFFFKSKGKSGVNGFLNLRWDVGSAKTSFFPLKRRSESCQEVWKVDLIRNLSILKFVFFMLDRNVWPQIVTTSQFLITMAIEMLLVFKC